MLEEILRCLIAKGEFDKDILFKQVMIEKIYKLTENKHCITDPRTLTGWLEEKSEILLRNIAVKLLRAKKNGNPTRMDSCVRA